MSLKKEKVRQMCTDLESEQIERTISTTDANKFAQAICAFSNDLPNTGRNGYLLIGVADKGKLIGLKAEDRLLQSLGGLRSDGNILPQPIMSVQSFSFNDGDVIVIEVQPSPFPPVRYKGRTWIRVGPRKAVANEMEERILIEKRTTNISTFDIRPSVGNDLESIKLKLFSEDYLPRAIDKDILADDKRDIDEQLASLRFYSPNYRNVTNAGLLVFGNEVERNIPGAYVQYVKFDGLSAADDIINEKKMAGNLFDVLYELDAFLEYAIINQKPVAVSALKEETRFNFPKWAIRELLMNAIMHRDYESNAAIKFYQFKDRIVIINPGGLYGNARPENFPDVNDYRNPVIAEAMKVLGYVNRFNRGIARVKKELAENGSKEAIYDYKNMGIFGVTVPDALFDKDSPEETAKKDSMKSSEKILQLITANKNITIPEMAQKIGITEQGVEYHLKKLSAANALKRIGAKKDGYWQIIEGT